VPHRKHNTSLFYSQELWPLDHRSGRWHQRLLLCFLTYSVFWSPPTFLPKVLLTPFLSPASPRMEATSTQPAHCLQGLRRLVSGDRGGPCCLQMKEAVGWQDKAPVGPSRGKLLQRIAVQLGTGGLHSSFRVPLFCSDYAGGRSPANAGKPEGVWVNLRPFSPCPEENICL
jgi:hypothetical protein